MSSTTIPLAVPRDLERQLRTVAKKTRLSIADVMRQSMIAGLPIIEVRLTPEKLEPATDEEMRACYSKPNPDFDALEHHMASLPAPPPPSFDE